MTQAAQFNAIIHAPGRLQICAILTATDTAEFSMLRDSIGVSDSVLSKHIRQLEEAGYVKVSKLASEGRQRTWLAMTPAGRAAFAAHTAELVRLAGIAGTL